jgi:signal transduction histidine kinase
MNTTNTKRLVDAVQELSLARTFPQVVEIVRTVGRELTGADGATFVLRDGNKCFYVDENAISPLWKGSRFPMSTCISGWVMLNKKSVLIPDIYLDDRIPHEAYRPTFVKSLAMVPIRTMEPIGAVGNYWAKEYLPSVEQLTLLQSLADVTAVTIENINVFNELEQRVKDRTERLEQANAALEKANQELEAFSYSISHDLRAPLRSILGYSDVIHEDSSEGLNDVGKRALTIIKKNATRMNLLIDDLLKFSKLGSREPVKCEIDTNALVREVISQLKADAFNAEFIIRDLMPVHADRVLLSQVWINLLSNAIKYSSKSPNPKIEVGSYVKKNGVVFFVKDNGVGFDMLYADKLFGVFQRLHKMEEFEGTGVGLSLVKRIINKHYGDVWAESEKDKGATFYFSLPNVN